MPVGDGLNCGTQIGVWIDAVQFAGFHQRRYSRPGAAALVVAGKERVLAVQRDRSDRVFDRIGVHLDTAISQEYQQPVPVARDIAELLAEAGFG